MKWITITVIVCSDADNRLYPLTDEVPKPLLPVAARPLLLYQLEMLERAGFAGITSLPTLHNLKCVLLI
jgi:NDP-sugar pyrophosphorylase family protein